MLVISFVVFESAALLGCICTVKIMYFEEVETWIIFLVPLWFLLERAAVLMAQIPADQRRRFVVELRPKLWVGFSAPVQKLLEEGRRERIQDACVVGLCGIGIITQVLVWPVTGVGLALDAIGSAILATMLFICHRRYVRAP